MKKTIYTGCSYTAGTGWPEGAQDQHLWAKQLHQQHPFLSGTEYCNLGIGGASNARIFYETVTAMVHNAGAIFFVAWTSTARYEMDVGFETYSCRQCFIPNTPMRQHNLNDCVLSEKYLEKIRDRFVSLVHDHREVCWILAYTNQLQKLAAVVESQVFFINALCPWDIGYFDRIEWAVPSELTPYTQKLLKVQTRDDHEVRQLYDIMHQDYHTQGSITSANWLNLYQSLQSLRIDVNPDGVHLGAETNQLATKLLLTNLDRFIK